MGPEFWLTSGFRLLERDGAGNLRVTDDFLRAYVERPELRPVEEACAAEIALCCISLLLKAWPCGARGVAQSP